MSRKKKENQSSEIEINQNPDTSKQDLGDKISSIDNLIDDFKETQEVEIKKTRKPRKPKKEDTQEEKNFADIALIQASIALDIIVSKMPKPIPLSDTERNSFDKSFTLLAQKYYNKIDKYAVEIQVALSLALIVIPRIDFEKIKNDRANKNNIREDRNREDITNKVSDTRESAQENNYN